VATLHCTTVSTVATVTDQSQVKQLFEEYDVVPKSYRVESGEVRIQGGESFIVFDEDGVECTVEFLDRLQSFLGDEELVIQISGSEGWRYPVVACQYRVTDEGVFYSDLDTDEKPVKPETEGAE
jgi:hypothetical protein